MTDTDYLESPEEHELDGVTFPQWGKNGEFTLVFNGAPFFFAVSDGHTKLSTP